MNARNALKAAFLLFSGYLAVKLTVMIAPALLALLVYTPSAAAQEAAGYCAQDPTHNHIVDTADIATFTSAFGQPNLALDYAPVPLGSGYVDTAELTGVTALFGQTCMGMWSGLAMTEANMARALTVPTDYPEIWGCAYNLWFPGYVIQNGYAYLTSWGGGAGCMHGVGTYNIACSIQVRQMYGQQWQIQAALGVLQGPGTVCVGNGTSATHALACGHLAAGWYNHSIHWEGIPWHGEDHWMLDSVNQAFTPC